MKATTSFQASINLPCLNNKTIDLQVNKGQNLRDVTSLLTLQYAIPPYLTTNIYSALTSAMNKTCQKQLSLNLHNGDLDKSNLRHLFMEAYQSNTLQYNNKPEEDIFPRAYHTLVHCPVPSIFDTLLDLEQSYAIAIQELQTASDHELVAIQARQAQEIEAVSSNTMINNTSVTPLDSPTDSMTAVFTHQVEEMEVFQATWQSDILSTQQTQRQEYREFVIELYKEYQARLASLSAADDDKESHAKKNQDDSNTLVMAEKKLDGKEIVAAAASRVRQWENQKEEQGSGGAGGSGTSIHSSDKKPSSTHSHNPITTRRRTGSLASSLSSIHSSNQQPQQYSPNELASLVRNSSSNSNIATATSLPNSSTTNTNINNPEFQNALNSIQEMGFGKDQAEAALVLNDHNMEAAIGLLLENPTQVDAYMAEQRLQQQQLAQQQVFQHMAVPPASSSTPYRRSYSLSQVPRPNLGAPSQFSASVSSSHATLPTESSGARRHSLQRFTTTPTFLNILNKSSSNSVTPPQIQPLQQQQQQQQQQGGNGTKSWNPISFLQQQKQNMENTNLSSVRKLGGWLGKAMENLGLENEENGGSPLDAKRAKQRRHLTAGNSRHYTPQPQLVESFSIMMGTAQIKSSHNLRLLVTEESSTATASTSEMFHPAVYDAAREMAYRAETATKLYTSHLSAAIALVEVSELASDKGWMHYRMGKGSNKALFDRCQQSTEFHFLDVESQIELIENDFETNGNGLVEGSFFITKHSNLPSTQVVFHLLIDSHAVTTNDLTNRHPLILGLRHILKTTTQYDISSLSIPLLLLPDRFVEQHPDRYYSHKDHLNWLIKRGETVMKCIKGFLIENSNSSKRVQHEGLDRAAESMGGGGMRNVEFLLPNQPAVYAQPTTLASGGNGVSATTTTAIGNSNNNGTVGSSSSSIMTSSPSIAHDGTMPTSTSHGSIPQEVELAFQQFRTSLVNLFRTS